MADEPKIESPSNAEEVQTARTAEDKRIDHIADRAAERAGRSEKRYDEGHDIFTK
jgi:hypothetical protein